MATGQTGMNPNKVVVKYRNQLMLKGTTANFNATKPSFSVDSIYKQHLNVHLGQLKAIFFVKTYNGNPKHRKNYSSDVAGQGVRTMVTFQDGEVLQGYTTGYNPRRTGFFVIPTDPEGNNERVFVINEATRDVRVF